MRNSAQAIFEDKTQRTLRFRAEAEAAWKAQEERENPADRNGFYLRRFQTMMSHLTEVSMGIGTVQPRIDFDGCCWSFFSGADLAIERAEEGDDLQQQDEEWRRLWDSLKAGLAAFQRWSGDAQKAAVLAKVLFVTSFVLRRAYEVGSECNLTGEERGFELCADELPIPLDVTLPLVEQVQIVSQNLEWFQEQMRREVVWPRWW